eukprot:GGOE01054777.1.p1 GENE.GGOE01054777.1~~GGOE01054777.1.p1  ORF type:complete len:426 (+),score=118.49 GGOE01054777.1:53-1330(+)
MPSDVSPPVAPVRVREFQADATVQEVILSSQGTSVCQAPKLPIAVTHASGNVAVRAVRSLLLPEGFPHSVTEDYLEFQIWDTVQAVCSYLRGILCTQAVLMGVGVGDAAATAASATVQWVLRDGLGMFGGMLFAWHHAHQFGVNVKQWRFFADCINDVGLTLDLVSPLFPRYFLLLVCLGSICRSMCGVAAGATRPGLSLHFARRGNLADISAKEGIQETLVTLFGLLAGLVCANALGTYGPYATWSVFLVLTAVHVVANYWGMRALALDTLNLQRATIVCRHHIRYGTALSPKQVAFRERLVWLGGRVRIGERFMDVVPSLDVLAQLQPKSDPLGCYLLAVAPQRWVPWGPTRSVVLHRRATPRDALRGLYHTIATDIGGPIAVDVLVKVFGEFEQQLLAGGWDLSRPDLGAGKWTADWTTGQA